MCNFKANSNFIFRLIELRIEQIESEEEEDTSDDSYDDTTTSEDEESDEEYYVEVLDEEEVVQLEQGGQSQSDEGFLDASSSELSSSN